MYTGSGYGEIGLCFEFVNSKQRVAFLEHIINCIVGYLNAHNLLSKCNSVLWSDQYCPTSLNPNPDRHNLFSLFYVYFNKQTLNMQNCLSTQTTSKCEIHPRTLAARPTNYWDNWPNRLTYYVHDDAKHHITIVSAINISRFMKQINNSFHIVRGGGKKGVIYNSQVDKPNQSKTILVLV